MNFWQYFQGMALEFEKKLASFFKFQSISILAMLSDKVLGNKTASLLLGFH